MERFDAEECLALIEQYKVTHGQFVPTMFVRMLKLPGRRPGEYDLSSPPARHPRRRALPDRGQARR